MNTAEQLHLQQDSELLAARLPPLLLAAQRVAATVAQGVHGRRRVGQGETFWQFRPYEMGDTPQSIDWRRTAKSEGVYVRQMEWEAAQSVWLWRDPAPSMSWRSGKALPLKRERAELLLLALSVLLLRAGERVALLGGERRPSGSKEAVARLAAALLTEPQPGAGENPAVGLPPEMPLPRFGQVILIGDFLAPLDQIEARICRFAERGLKGLVIQVLDPAEETLPYEGRVRFFGIAEESDWLVSRVDEVRHAYQERLAAQQAGLLEILQRVGWRTTFHRTDHPAQTALLAAYQALSVEEGLA